LDPDESATVNITLDTRAFAYWSVAAQDWAIEPGDYEIRVGFSSRDIARTDTITLAGNVGVGTLDAMSTIGEWLAHPVGSAVLGAAMSAAAGEGAQSVSPEMMALAGSMPLGKLATFGLGITEEQVEQLVAAAAQPAS
ncbi:MAG: fibronectin type III-like domain-contianing protein, partial [Rhodococcus sp. (in: high G+C Gram-positive bacteria)]